MRRSLVLFALATLGVAANAEAAVRACTRTALASGPIEAASEVEAKREALAKWMESAAQLGEGFTSWRLAFGKSLECNKTDSGRFNCEARGQACTIRQVPDQSGFSIQPAPGQRQPGKATRT